MHRCIAAPCGLAMLDGCSEPSATPPSPHPAECHLEHKATWLFRPDSRTRGPCGCAITLLAFLILREALVGYAHTIDRTSRRDIQRLQIRAAKCEVHRRLRNSIIFTSFASGSVDRNSTARDVQISLRRKAQPIRRTIDSRDEFRSCEAFAAQTLAGRYDAVLTKPKPLPTASNAGSPRL
jgi:hypothetical protein